MLALDLYWEKVEAINTLFLFELQILGFIKTQIESVLLLS